ncbi:hypothetical protein HD806DRAFT_315625 [Xylariaceae sp. AK1471]|nr:hypothetical protein HD806DRAFT_315625 [Xylariaceae sp. AK1471]
MEVIGAIASFIAIGQAIGATPKIIDTLRSFTRASKELAALITELDCLFMLYQHMKENIDLFSGGHNPSLLRDLADSCQRDGGHGPKVSKLRWWKKRESIARLRDECQKQRQQLQHLYMLFRDQIIHKQGEILVHIHARISQKDQVSPRDTSSLSSTNDAHITELPNSVENGAIVSQRDTVSLNSTTKAEVVVDRRCRCSCHTHKRSRQAQGLHMNLSRGWLSARLRAVRGNKCELNCCAATQTIVHIWAPFQPAYVTYSNNYIFG